MKSRWIDRRQNADKRVGYSVINARVALRKAPRRAIASTAQFPMKLVESGSVGDGYSGIASICDAYTFANVDAVIGRRGANPRNGLVRMAESCITTSLIGMAIKGAGVARLGNVMPRLSWFEYLHGAVSPLSADEPARLAEAVAGAVDWNSMWSC